MAFNHRPNTVTRGDVVRVPQSSTTGAVSVSSGSITTSPPSSASTSNNSTTPLAGGATFTGTGEQNDLQDVICSCKTDAAGTLYFDFSNDNSNWDTFPVAGFAVAAGIHEFHTAVKGGRYFRVRLVNGSTAQTYLRLYTYFGQSRQGNLPINQGIGADADAIVVRTVDSAIDLALGRFGGMEEASKFGYSTGLGTSIQLGTPSTWVDVWAYGGQRTSPTTTFTPYMASTSAADTDIDITWTYIDSSGDEQTVTVATDATDGQTPVSLGVTAQEVYRGIVDDATDIAGTVSCTTANNFTSGDPDNQGEVLAVIAPNDNQTQVLARRIPAGMVGIVRHLRVEVSRANGSAGSASISLDTRETGKVWRSRRVFAPTTSVPSDTEIKGLVLPALTDIRVRVRDVSDSGTTITGAMDLFVVEN